MTTIHPTAIVDKNAELDSGVVVGPYSIIGPNVKIGKNTNVLSHVVIDGHVTLGAENEIFPFASVGGKPQDLKYKGEPTTLVIGARNSIRQSVVLHPGTVTGTSTTTIGDDNLFMVGAHVAHDCRVGNGNVFANQATLAGHVTIGNRVILGGLVAIHQFARIGDFALLGGGAMAAQDIPPYCIAQGDRAKLRGVNVIGLRRSGQSDDAIKAMRRAYHAIVLGTGPIKERIASVLQADTEHAIVKHFIEFYQTSTRGVARGGLSDDSAD
ncbi:acyl-ACP--UDP-N-acetylglucosamine O-acyltransferase [bacterium]|nr:acyl-ACP--UDP-N-acetylglucosamine O-acyltransferase [bacterium]